MPVRENFTGILYGVYEHEKSYQIYQTTIQNQIVAEYTEGTFVHVTYR